MAELVDATDLGQSLSALWETQDAELPKLGSPVTDRAKPRRCREAEPTAKATVIGSPDTNAFGGGETPELVESGFKPGDHSPARTNHRLATTAAERDDEGCQRGHEPDKGVNQQCEINVSHGFFLVFVRLNWRDVSEGKSRFQKHNGKGRAAPRTRDEAAQAQRGSESPWTLCGTG